MFKNKLTSIIGLTLFVYLGNSDLVLEPGETQHANLAKPPRLTKRLSAGEGIEGADFLLSCEARGIPPPKYNFSINGVPILNGSRVNVNRVTGRVLFAPLNRSDEGNVSCIAYNDVGMVNSTEFLSVKISPVITSFVDKVVREGDNVVLECLSDGVPKPYVTIKKSGNNSYKGYGERLGINSVSKDAAGVYTCEVRSEFGSHKMSANLTVEFIPRFIPGQPKKFFSWEKQRRNMSCSVEANPAPTFGWFIAGQELINNDTFVIFNVGHTSYLQVYITYTDQSWIYTTYVCNASNSMGSVDIDIKLLRAISPDIPRDIKLLETYATHVVLNVVPPIEDEDTMPVSRIKVVVDGIEDQEFAWSESITVKKLKPGSDYKLKVYVGNEIDYGASESIHVTTLPARIPYPIKVISNRNSSSVNSYQILWDEPIDAGLPLIEYKIKYRLNSTMEEWTIILSQNVSTFYSTLHGLKPKSIYQLEVYARNELGWSEIPEEFYFETAEIKTPPPTHEGALGVGAIIALVLLFLMAVDISCFYIRGSSAIVKFYKKIFGNPASPGLPGTTAPTSPEATT